MTGSYFDWNLTMCKITDTELKTLSYSNRLNNLPHAIMPVMQSFETKRALLLPSVATEEN